MMNGTPRFYAVIDSRCGCEACTGWMRDFGDDHVAILDPRPHKGIKPDGGVDSFVFVDVSAMDDGQVERCCADIGRRFGIDPAEIRKDMFGEHGFPILVGGKAICTDVAQGRRILRSRYRCSLKGMPILTRSDGPGFSPRTAPDPAASG